MRVLQLITAQERRGAEVFALGLTVQLEKLGNDTKVAALYGGSQELPLRACDTNLGAAKSHAFEGLPGFQPSLVGRLPQLCMDWQPDVVQLNGSRTVKYGCLGAGSASRKWALVYRNIGDPEQWLRDGLKRIVYRRLLARADGVVGVSEASLAQVQRIYGFTGPVRQPIHLVVQEANLSVVARQLVSQLLATLCASRSASRRCLVRKSRLSWGSLYFVKLVAP
ncbi:MAG: glycosyltransferase family 4 protein [Acidobacteriota bacterium]|nr:glycosyltransferase family 4 protein [Acidobacteriota bacterium]